MLAQSTSGPLSGNWRTLAIVVAAFFVAWLVSRASGIVAGWAARWYDHRQLGGDVRPADSGVLLRVKRRETLTSLVRTSVRYLAYGIALAICFVQLSGWSRATAIAGASVLIVLIGFAGQRVIEQTIREKLPEGFQRAEYLLDHGMLDMVVHRENLRTGTSLRVVPAGEHLDLGQLGRW